MYEYNSPEYRNEELARRQYTVEQQLLRHRESQQDALTHRNAAARTEASMLERGWTLPQIERLADQRSNGQPRNLWEPTLTRLTRPQLAELALLPPPRRDAPLCSQDRHELELRTRAVLQSWSDEELYTLMDRRFGPDGPTPQPTREDTIEHLSDSELLVLYTIARHGDLR